MSCYLGIDVGGSFIKGAVLFPSTGKVGHIIKIPFPSFLEGLPRGHREVDRQEIVEAFRIVFDAIYDKAPKALGVCLTGQMGGGMEEYGNFISWQDTLKHLTLTPLLEWLASFITGMPVHIALGDHQCAKLGSGVKENDLFINIGTGSQVAYRDKTISFIPAGRSLNAMIRLFKTSWPEVIDVVDKIKDTDVQVDMSFFAAAFNQSGAIFNLQEDDLSIGHIFLAAFKSMAHNYQIASEKLDPSKSWSEVVLAGGLARRMPRLQKLIAEKFTAPIHLVDRDETLYGLMELAKTL